MWVYFVEEIPFKMVWSAVGKTIKVFVTMVEDGSLGYKTTNLLCTSLFEYESYSK